MMNKATLKVLLTDKVYEGVWGSDPLVTVENECAYIHLTPAHCELSSVAAAGRSLDSMGFKNVTPSGDGWDFERIYAFVTGYNAAFDKNFVQLAGFDDPKLVRDLNRYITVFDWLKFEINSPASELDPEQFAQDCEDFLADCGAGETLTMKTVFYDDLLENGYVGTEAVGRGSECKSCVFIAEYNPQHTDTVDVALVGKGITFDSGGYSLKSADGMLLMKSDMGGAATAVAALGLMILRGLPYHVKLVICCAENMVSGSSYKPGDHLEYPNGVTVEVLNTDAEGRLILADGLIEAQKSKPELLIDVATLTGAAKVALGRDYNAALSFDEKLSFLFKKSAEQEHERAWPLPLDRFHRNLVKGVNTDIVNSVSAEGTAGASTAAAFLSYFVNEGQQWLHIDLGASFQKCANQFYAPGAKGHGFRSIVRFIENVIGQGNTAK